MGRRQYIKHKNKENRLCETGLTFPIWKNDKKLLEVPLGCKCLWLIELFCECFLPIKPESVLQPSGGGWAGGLEWERLGEWAVMAAGLRLQACQLAWPSLRSQLLGFLSS